jgi:SAM-dependent methyltransferase
MTEWKLHPESAPRCTTLPFFENHPWSEPALQQGHAQRTAMAAELIFRVHRERPFASVSDLGCAEGSLLAALAALPVKRWGYEISRLNLEAARNRGLDVRRADIVNDSLEYGELITATEVLEHLADPHGFLARLPGKLLVVSSPSLETDEWNYHDHAWAWDLEGYVALVSGAGWTVLEQVDCDGGTNAHGGIERPQRFQAIAAVRED